MTVKNFDKRQVSGNVFNFLENTTLHNIVKEALDFKGTEDSFFMVNHEEIIKLYNEIFTEYKPDSKRTDALLFLKLTGLYELKQEPKYFIKLPHFGENKSYINYFPLDGAITLDDEEEIVNIQTQFTMKEIENNPMLKEYSEYTVEVTE